ncbi:UDP-N-acetylmuramoylalanine--D-glutamate ligase [[Clostridium] fimetarium]|uniref:UDP-N-acetylmuramoylalanine--D-glutamate ligase n=2 Tax=[Clostridium] fimetarium TaxID=99656 RepID=A0A1I0MTG6_9FIRM|nr:UDP-N-acetylmuramoylalanine--D-glutamate ligase [[Clostridium] fimetarium]
MMELKDKKVMVVGTGISGIGAAELLYNVGAKVVLYDGDEKLLESDILNKIEGCKAEIIIGALEESVVKSIDLVIISPGVPIDSDIVLRFEKANIPVWGEIELAYNYDKGRIIAITGTNGKTTTTALVGQIVKAYNKETFVVGNIGNSYTGEVLKTSKNSFTVAEISSFQLETTHKFKPSISAILNITPDHLNRHKTMENYAFTKENIAINQTKSEICVLNYDDPILREYAKTTTAKVIYFSRLEVPEIGSFMDGDLIKYFDGDSVETICDVNNMNLIGAHNYENVMAAVAIAKSAQIPTDIIVAEILKFKAVEHRIEYVATKHGVMYYNDSKGTNPEAAVKAIEAMSRPTILIGGGYDKKSEFDIYVKAFEGKVKLLVLIGQTKELIAETARKYGFDNIIMAESLQEVIKICVEHAEVGDAVLLSPACASWGMFDNYEQRGELFKEYVNLI